MGKQYRNPILDCRGEIFGLATLMIVFHHLSNRGIPGSSVLPTMVANILDFVFAKAYIGVDIFIFLSAVGLCYSMERNTVGAFFGNRFRRVVIPWLVIMIPVFIVEDIVLCGEGVLEVLLDTTTLRYWVDNDNTHTPWFVPFIIALYLLFPLLYKLDSKTKHIGTVILLLGSIGMNIVCGFYPNYVYSEFTYCFARLPIFLIGILSANAMKTSESIKKPRTIHLVLILVSVFALYCGWFFMELPTGVDMLVGGVIALGIIAFYAYVIKPIVFEGLSSVLVFVGTVSLEVYLIHTVIIRVLDNTVVPDIWFAAQYLLLPISSVMLAKGASWLSEHIVKAIDHLKVNRKSEGEI